MMNSKIHMRVKGEEWYAVIFSFVYYFCILGAYYIMRPIRDQLAVEVGSAQLPWFFAATFVATLLLTPLFSCLTSRWPRRTIMPLVNLLFIVCQLIFIFLLNHKDLISIQTLGLIFFVWVSIFNLFMVSVFWSFMTDIWDDLQARRLFPLIALGGTAGAIMGPIITRSAVEVLGLAFLLMLSAAFLLLAVICVLFLGNWAHKHGAHRHAAGNESALGGGMLDGLKQIFTNPFIRCMSLMMLLSDAIGTIAYVLVTDYSGATFPHDAIAQTRFAANMDLSANIIQIVVQLTVTRWLLVRYGAGSLFALWAAISVVACLSMAFALNPHVPILWGMPSVALVMILTRSLSYGMLQPARETLYTLVPRNLRYKGKNAVDTAVWRAGDVVSLVSIHGFQAMGMGIAGFGAIWAALAATSGWIGWSLAHRVEKKDFEKN